MTVPEPISPRLHISHIVYGREKRGNRLWYLIDPTGVRPERAVPETVVLTRWRRRQLAGYKFSGERLSSTVWRAMLHAFHETPDQLCSYCLQQLQERIDQERQGLRKKLLLLPSAATLHAMLAILGPKRLEAILARHTELARTGKSGVPDLFLFARDSGGNYGVARFVEVKCKNERLSHDQRAELEFVRSLGLHARVLRLQERLSKTQGEG